MGCSADALGNFRAVDRSAIHGTAQSKRRMETGSLCDRSLQRGSTEIVEPVFLFKARRSSSPAVEAVPADRSEYAASLRCGPGKNRRERRGNRVFGGRQCEPACRHYRLARTRYRHDASFAFPLRRKRKLSGHSNAAQGERNPLLLKAADVSVRNRAPAL